MKYNVGDKVRIKPKNYFCSVDGFNNINMKDEFLNEYSRLPYCEKVMTIKFVSEDFYLLKEDAWTYKWTDEMIECKVEKGIKLKFKKGDKITSGNITLTILALLTDRYVVEDNFGECGTLFFNTQDDWKLVEEEIEFTEEDKFWCDIMSESDPTTYVLPQGYQFVDENGNVINATKIVLEKESDDKLKLESTKKVREYWSEHARIFIEIYDDKPNECILTHLYTLESYRQKGYGKQALIQAEEIAKELGCHKAYLKAETDSWMHQWYLRCGYQWYNNAPDNYTWLIKNLNNMEKKKKEYPKTYEECCKVIDYALEGETIIGYKASLLRSLQKLLICRDAYWKLYGEEMGLGKPWEPDWNIRGYYAIARSYGNVVKTSNYNCDLTFVFPTEEMRDAFYEAFKEEIEKCKEFL